MLCLHQFCTVSTNFNITAYKMSLMTLTPASGIGKSAYRACKIIRFVRYGCANRPFFHIVVMDRMKNQHQPVIEQLGSYDPMENQFGEKLVAFNFERIRLWLGKGAQMSKPVAELLGLSGFLPIHPMTYMRAWRNRKDGMPSKEDQVSKGES